MEKAVGFVRAKVRLGFGSLFPVVGFALCFWFWFGVWKAERKREFGSMMRESI